MPTPIFVCGAECGLDTTGTTGPGVEHWSSAGGVTVATSGPSSMRSTRAFRFNTTAASARISHTFASSIASPATMVSRFYIYFATLPSGDCQLFTGNTGTTPGVRFVASDNSIRAGDNAGTAASGQVVTTGVWYRVDVKSVSDSTQTVDVQVDGVALTQYSRAVAASGQGGCGIGQTASVTADFYIDDLIVSGTSGDYPIGVGTCVGLYPNADGSHSYNATTDFVDGGDAATALAAAGSEVDTWQSLQTVLSTTIDTARYIKNQTATGSERLEWQFGNTPASVSSVNGLMLVSTQRASGTATCLATLQVNDNGTIDAVYTDADFSETTIITATKVYATAPSTGSAWSKTLVDGIRVRWLGSADVNPDPILDGVCFEVDYVSSDGGAVAVTGKGAIANTGRAQAEIQARVTGRGAVATAGRASTQLALAVTGHGDASTAGTANLTVESDNGENIAFTGRANNATTGTATSSISLAVTGRANHATTVARNTLLVAVDLTGKAANATTGRAAILLAAGLTGHADTATHARTAALLAVALSGRANNATTGRANLSVESSAQPDPDPCAILDEDGHPLLDESGDQILDEQCGAVTPGADRIRPRFGPVYPPEPRVFKTRIRIPFLFLVRYTARPVFWTVELVVDPAAVTVIGPRRSAHHAGRVEHRAQAEAGCRRTRIATGARVETRTVQPRTYRRELMLLANELL